MEVQEDFSPAYLVDQAEKLLADDLDILLVENFAIHEIDHGHVADVLHLQAAPTRLRRHNPLLESSGTARAAQVGELVAQPRPRFGSNFFMLGSRPRLSRTFPLSESIGLSLPNIPRGPGKLKRWLQELPAIVEGLADKMVK